MGNLSIEGKFDQEKYELTVTSGEGGSATGGGTFTYGEKATLYAEPQAGYLFSGWEGLSSGVYENPTVEVIVLSEENARKICTGHTPAYCDKREKEEVQLEGVHTNMEKRPP